MSHARWSALAVLCAGALMAIVDETIVAVSLPVIQHDLGFSRSGLAWVTGSYLIAFAGLLLLSGRLGDLVGRRRVFLAGLATFTVASALCALAWNAQALVAARFVQGIGAAAMTAVILGMIVTLFPAPKDRAKAIGAFSFVQASGGTIGTLAGGLITESVSWHWIFLVNVPIGAIAFVLAIRLLAKDTATGIARGADVPGAALVTAALMTAIYTVIRVEEHGWASVHTLGFGALALALLAAFVARQARASKPLLPLRILRSVKLSGGNIAMFLLVFSMFGFMFVTVLYLREVLGYGARQTGFAMLPVAVMIGLVSLGVSARVNTRFGEWPVLLVGVTSMFAGFVLFSVAPLDASFAAHVLPPQLLLGFGSGLSIPALMSLGMSGVGEREAGLASGLFSTVQQMGAALGLSVLAVVAATRTEGLLAEGRERAESLLSGFHLAYLVSAGVSVVTLAFVAVVLRPSRALRGRAAVSV
ncbi:DHA2 family efflux MFS transporter permease subunit [Saccharomonospora sp. NPDC006951]